MAASAVMWIAGQEQIGLYERIYIVFLVAFFLVIAFLGSETYILGNPSVNDFKQARVNFCRFALGWGLLAYLGLARFPRCLTDGDNIIQRGFLCREADPDLFRILVIKKRD